MDRLWLADLGRNSRPPMVAGSCEVLPLRAELLAVGGSLASIRRRGRRRSLVKLPRAIAALLLSLLLLAGYGVVLAALIVGWAIVALLRRYLEPVAMIIGIAVAVATIAIALGWPG